MSEISFSVICPTYEGEINLVALIECLEVNLEKIDIFPEIIFVIDNSTDSSEALLVEFRTKHPEIKITIHKNATNLGPGHSRNIGVQLASGMIMLFLDDDCRPGDNWYRDVTSIWKSIPENIKGIGGFVVPTELETFNGKYCSNFNPIKPWPLIPESISIFQRIKNYYQTPNPASQGVAYLAGANMSVRKEAFEKVGGFSPALRIAEDIGVCKCLRLIYGDDCLAVFETLSMPHEYSARFTNTIRRSYRYGLGSGKNFSRGRGALSFNLGPTLVFGVLIVSMAFSLIFYQVLEMILVNSVVFFLFEIVFYSLWVTQSKSIQGISVWQKFLLGFGFLICEIANSFGFASGLFSLKNPRDF